MIDSIVSFIENGIGYIKKHPQLLMTLVLIIVIPVAFLVSGQQFLSASHDNQERLELDRIGIMHDIFASFLKAGQFNSELIQNEIERISQLNPDITKFNVAKEEKNSVSIIASLTPDLIGKKVTLQEADSYRLANTNPSDSFLVPIAQNGIRYWQGFRLVQTDGGDDYYIFTETSLEQIDLHFANRIMTAYYWLIGLMLIVLLLIMRHIRLIDYSYLYRETKRTNEMKDLFTNMIAHELRAPLTAMRGYASMIREKTNLDEDTKTQAKKIEDSAERLVLIVSDLLDVARIQSGKLLVVKGELNISDLIVSVIDAIQISAKEKNVEITHEGVHSGVMISGDEKRLYQALTNLVSNAIKYTKQGAITVSLQDMRERVEIRVKDTGMGISADNQKNLFAPFFRVENEEVSNITGTGLGMWITKQLIELMGGSIGVESIKGVGTHVVVTLPKT